MWRIGTIPCTLPSADANNSYLNSLGDTAVDFDIAPPRVIQPSDDDKDNKNTGDNGTAEWPLVILRGNGTVYVALIGVDTEK